jgi:hypothetical protein
VATAPTYPRAVPGSLLQRFRKWPDARPVAVLVVLPVVVFAVPAMAGHPAISYDNLLQNFPLRVLSGSDFRQGHLPLWNPTIWSGSPLLGGLNAGSFYPGTLLFAVLPGVLAWVLNLLAVYWAAGLGLYALVRQFGLRPLACGLAAVTYQFGGAMTGQLVHLGIIQGMAWMPLLVLAELRLSWAVLGTGPTAEYRRRPVRAASPWGWTAVLAALIGLNLLTGEPRSMAETELVASALLAWLLLRSYPGDGVTAAARYRLLFFGVLAAAWAVLIGASELLPGRSFIVASQRANESYAFFGLGSLRPSWTILLLVQNLFGGNGVFGQPAFSIGYNLPEVTGYVGLLPLAGFFVLLVRSLGRRSDPRARDWRPWLFITALGLLLSWGTFTPLGHLFALIPFYNKVRLDSRSLGIVDLGLAVLFAFFLELVLAGEWRERVVRPLRWVREVAVPMAVPLAGLAAAVTMVAVPTTVLVALGATPTDSPGRRPWMAAQAAIALGALGVLWAWRRWPAAAVRRLVVVVVVADLGLFCLSCSTGMWDGGTPQPTRAAGTAIVGTTGRFALVGVPSFTLFSAVEPDLNGLTGIDSVQGYGSIVAGDYDTVTGTHFRSSMDPCALARGVFVPLRLSTVLVPPGSLTQRLAPGATPTTPATCSGAPAAGTVSSRSLYFGRSLELSSTAIAITHPQRPASALVSERERIRVGVLGPGGTLAFPTAVVTTTGSGWSVRFREPVVASGIVVDGPSAHAVAETSTVTTTSGVRYELDGPFQAAFGQSSWHQHGFVFGYARFVTSKLGPKVAVNGVPGATARVLSTTQWGTETDAVDTPRSALVVRSEAYLAGWRVEAVPVGGGPARTLPVVKVGLIQGVVVPAGRWRLTFTYWPSGLTLGGVASAVSVLALFGVGCWRWRVRRRTRTVAGAAH